MLQNFTTMTFVSNLRYFVKTGEVTGEVTDEGIGMLLSKQL